MFKTEVINQIGPWKSMHEVEWETLKWVDWYNNRRLPGPIGYITPAEAEEAFHANLNTLDMVAQSLSKSPSGKPGAVQLAIGIEPVVVKTMTAIHKHAAEAPVPKVPTPRSGTKQAMLIALLQTPEGATMDEIVAATGWLAHTARGAMSGALGKKLGLVVTSGKEAVGARVYRINPRLA